MSKRTTRTDAFVSPLQPRLSRIITHLQPGQLECIFGIDQARLSLVHDLLGRVSPLLILGDDAMGRNDLARALIVQLTALNDPDHLRLAVLERSSVITPLIEGLPHLYESTDDLQTLLPVLRHVGGMGGSASLTGSRFPAWVVIVHELNDFLQDGNASGSLSLRSLIERASERPALHFIVLSQRGVPEVNALFQGRIAFSTCEQDWYSPLFERGDLVEQLRRDQQQGQFLFVGSGAETLQASPLSDVEGLVWHEGTGLGLLLHEVTPVACSALSRLLEPVAGEAAGATLVGVVADHARQCVRCRHGVVSIPRAVRKANVLDCEGCRQRFPAYYEATHPDHRLMEMPDRELLEVALHLGCCPACSEQWSTLFQIAVNEEEGRC